MRVSGRILGACLAQLARSVRAGMTTLDLDREAETFIRDHHCIPGFLGFEGFPNSLCVSINEQVVHGIPGPLVIQDGDLVSLDCGLILDGWWADSGLSVACGEPSPEVRRLIDTTRQALDLGIAAAKPGNHIGDIGAAVQTYVEANGYSVVRQYVGHGIGRDMHEAPAGAELRPARHRQPAQARLRHRDRADGQRRARRTPASSTTTGPWSPSDGKLSCYFEHTVAITESGPEVLTLRPDPVWRTCSSGSRRFACWPGCGLYSFPRALA